MTRFMHAPPPGNITLRTSVVCNIVNVEPLMGRPYSVQPPSHLDFEQRQIDLAAWADNLELPLIASTTAT